MKKSDLCEEHFLGAARLDALWSQCIHLHSLTNSPASFHRNPTLMESNSCHWIEKELGIPPRATLWPSHHPLDPLLKTHIKKNQRKSNLTTCGECVKQFAQVETTALGLRHVYAHPARLQCWFKSRFLSSFFSPSFLLQPVCFCSCRATFLSYLLFLYSNSVLELTLKKIACWCIKNINMQTDYLTE